MAEGWPLWFPTHRPIELRDEWGTVHLFWDEIFEGGAYSP